MGVKEDLAEFRKIWAGYWGSRVVLTANNLEIFAALREPKTAVEAAEATGTSLRGMTILLDALASLELVRKRGGRYANGPQAKKFLLRESPWYQGDMLRHADALWKKWSHLDEVVRTGLPPAAEGRSADEHRAFILAMHNNAVARAKPVLDAVGLKGVSRALDLAGGPGTYAMEMARRGVGVTLFDFPETVAIAAELAAAAGLSVDFRAGNALEDPLGDGYDLILVSQLIHAFSPEQTRELFRRCRAALAPGGRLVVQEFHVARDMASPPSGALFSVNMLVNTDGGRCYPPEEIGALMRGAGLGGIATTLLGESTLVVGAARQGRR